MNSEETAKSIERARCGNCSASIPKNITCLICCEKKYVRGDEVTA